jgi:hypothetical protein
MCNCGKKRNENLQRPNASVSNIGSRMPASDGGNTNFEYTGKTALTVTGNITRKNYRFNYPGDVQIVDYRDVSGMMSVSVLKKVK